MSNLSAKIQKLCFLSVFPLISSDRPRPHSAPKSDLVVKIFFFALVNHSFYYLRVFLNFQVLRLMQNEIKMVGTHIPRL